MATFEFKLPDIGEGVTEGEIVNWLVDVGDRVAENQDIVEVMTDKATVTIGAPKAGIISELRGREGDVVPVGGVLVVFDLGGEPEAAGEPTPAAAPEADAAAVAVGDLKEVLPGMPTAPVAAEPAVVPAPVPAPAPAPVAASQSEYHNEQPLAAPATRKLARELGVDLARVEPSGQAGRVTREDVERFQRARQAPPPGVHEAVTLQPAPEPGYVAPRIAMAPAPVVETAAEERIPIRGLRRRIYENMARSKHTAAHFTFVDECDVSRLRDFRERARPAADRDGVKLTFLPFIIKAVVAALKRHPQLNALVDDERQEIVRRRNFHVGVAAATDAGLIVPVLRDVDRLSVLEIAQELTRLGEAARDGKIRPEDLGGSSFTITSLGKLGGLFATPVVNYPEVAILGVHEMKRRPVVRGDQIAVGEVMMLSVSFDHRVIDGHVGAAFARELIELLEEPERLMLEMR